MNRVGFRELVVLEHREHREHPVLVKAVHRVRLEHLAHLGQVEQVNQGHRVQAGLQAHQELVLLRVERGQMIQNIFLAI